MDQSTTMKYMRASQQLQRKTEELEKVFEEAQALERHNMRLSAENRELKARNEHLESQAQASQGEFKALEAQVRKQQQRLQQYIENEVRNSAAVMRPREASLPPPAPQPTPKEELSSTATDMTPMRLADAVKEIAALKRRVGSVEEARRAALEASEKYKQGADLLVAEVEKQRREMANASKHHESEKAQLTEELEGLKRSEAALKEVIQELKQHNALVISETEKMDDIETKAREGLKAEWLAMSNENRRLKEKLAVEQEQYAAAKNEFQRFQDLVLAERSSADDRIRLAFDEVSAINRQHDELLSDLKHVVADRDKLRQQLKVVEAQGTTTDETRAVIAEAQAVRHEIGPITWDQGTMTTPEKPPPPPPERPEEEEEQNHSVSRDIVNRLTSEIASLQQERGELAVEVEELHALVREKDETHKLHSERETLQQKENDDLQNTVAVLKQELRTQEKELATANKTRLEQVLQGGSMDSATLQEMLGTVKKLLILSTKVLHTIRKPHDSATRNGRSASNMSTDSITEEAERSYPVVPCNRFSSVELNTLFGQLGGIEHVLKSIRYDVHHQRKQDHQLHGVDVSIASAPSPNVRETHYAEDLQTLQRTPQTGLPPPAPAVNTSTVYDPMATLLGGSFLSTTPSGAAPNERTAAAPQGGLVPPPPPAGESLLEAAASAQRANSQSQWEQRRVALLNEQVGSLLESTV